MTEPPAKRKGIFYGWWILAASMGIQLFSGSLLGGFGTILVPLEREFGWNKTVFAGAAGLRQIESGLLGPLQGWLNDRYGSESLVRIGVVIWGLGFILLSQVDTIPMFYLAFLTAAVGSSIGGVQTLNIPIVNWFERKRATALALLTTGFSIGGLLVPLVAYLIDTQGWRTTMFGAGILIIAAGIPLSFVIRHRPEPYGYLPDGADPATQTAQQRAASRKDPNDFTTKEAMRSAAFWLTALGHASALVVVSSINLYFVSFLTDTMGMPLVEAAGYATALNAVSIGGQVIGGFVGDRYEKRLISALCMFGHMSGILMLAYGSGLWTVGLFLVLHGLAWGIRGPLMVAIRADYFGRSSFGTINGVASGVTTLGTLGGPLIVGTTTDAFGSYVIGFTVLAVISGLGSILFYLGKRPPRPVRIAV